MQSSSRASSKLGIFGVFGCATLLALYACSSSSDNGVSVLPTTDGAVHESEDGMVTGGDASDDVIVSSTDAPAEAAPVSLVNVSTVNITVSGTPRDYVLSVPKTYDSSKTYPLIIALAGDGQTADGLRTFLNMDAITGNDAITAYPDSVYDLYDDYSSNVDQQLVAATITDVEANYKIDTTKIWGFGYSKGGYILNHLECVHPGLFNKFAAHATGGPEDMNGNPLSCLQETPTEILESMGDQDTDPDPGADDAAQYWAEAHGCMLKTTTITPSACITYNGCPAGEGVEYCLAPGVAHFPIWDQATAVSWAFYNNNSL